MRAMVYHGTRDLRLEHVDEPVPGPDEVKLRIDYCGICATDIEEYVHGPREISHETPHPITGGLVPIVTGHEIAGTAVEVGNAVGGVQPGDRVVVNGVQGCEECWWCRNGQTTQCALQYSVGFARDGGLAEHMVWPGSGVIRLPDSLASDEAALIEPTSVGVHALRRGRLSPGERVAVLGVGTVGMLTVQAAKAMGAEVFAIDRRQMSLDLAEELGANAAVNTETSDVPKTLRDLTDGKGPDIVVDSAGGPDTPALAVETVRRGGRVVVLAIYASKSAFDFNSLIDTEAEMIGTQGNLQADMEEAVRLVASGEVKTKPLISDVIGLEQVVDVGFARMMASTKDIFRILVAPSGGKTA